MKKMLYFIKKREKSDSADSVLISVMFFIPLLFILLGFSVDISKNIYIKAERVSMIQQSAETAVKTINSDGSLDWKVLDSVVSEYSQQRGHEKSENPDPATNSSNSYDNEGCMTRERDGQELQLPYYTITLDTGRATEKTEHAKTISFSKEAPDINQIGSLPELDPGETYRSVRVNIIDGTKNLFPLNGNCQYFDIERNAIAFGSNTDL